MSGLEEGCLGQAEALGFALAGIAAPTPADDFPRYQAWLDRGFAGEMAYLHKHADARRQPQSVYPDVRSVIMVGMNYAPAAAAAEKSPFPTRIARYAHGADYHLVLRDRLKQLLAWLRGQRPGCWGRAVVDTAPLLERDFARRAGLGWIGKNTLLLNPRRGSWLVLGALLVDVELTPTPAFTANHCGTCTRCLDACPTDAFVGPYQLDARRCISYLTIELKRDVPAEWRTSLGDWLFGCDVCQEVCPWNRKAPPGDDALAPRPDLVAVDAADLLRLSAEAFAARFAGTALHPRPGRAVVLRNAALVLGNTGDARALPVLREALTDAEPLVRAAAAWAVARVERRAGRDPGEP